jgi:ribosomal-protein-alanine N-acetyltransferase
VRDLVALVFAGIGHEFIVPRHLWVRYAEWTHERNEVPDTWETDRLQLRLLGPDASAAVRDYGLRSAGFHGPFDPTRPPDYWELPVVADRLVCQCYEADQDRSLCLFIAHKSEPGRILGAVNLRNIIRGALMSCTLGYGLAPDAVGHGYMTESVQRIVDIAFDELALHRVEVNIMPRNAPSLAVAERCGFMREGMSPRYLKIAGKWEDHVRLARLSHRADR